MKQRVLYISLATILVLVLPSVSHAGYKVNYTTAENFPSGIEKVAIVTVDCHEMLNCREIERRLSLSLRAMIPGFRVATEKEVHDALFELGVASYEEAIRSDLCEALDANAVIEIRVPFGEKGIYGWKKTKSKVFMRIVAKGGELLLAGEGSGRGTTVSTPEGVANKIARKILKKALGK